MDVQLNDPQFVRVPAKKLPHTLTELLVAHKIVKTENDAKVALIIMLILVISATVLVIESGKPDTSSGQLSPDELIIKHAR